MNSITMFYVTDNFHSYIKIQVIRKTLISSAKSHVQIPSAQLIQLTSLYNQTRN